MIKPINEPLLITDYQWPDGTQPLVTARITTYMHAKYIRNCIEGVLMQKTTFPVQVLIHDDASTDGTADIVREYERKFPNLITAIIQTENTYSKPDKIERRKRIRELVQGKYIAVCEGDDYWTDPYKLQKQVDFLEANPGYGMVHTELDHYYVKTGKYIKDHWKTNGITKQEGDLYEDILLGKGGMIYACTAMYRFDLMKDMHLKNRNKYAYGDIPTWLYIASKSKIGYIDESMAVRNVLPYSATQGRDFEHKLRFLQTSELIFEDFRQIRPVSKEVEHQYYQKYHAKVCELCYKFQKRYDLFKEHYAKLDPAGKTEILKLKRFLFKHGMPVSLSRALVYTYKRIGPGRNAGSA